MIINPRFVDCNDVPRGNFAEILIVSERIVERAGSQLAVKTKLRINVCIEIQAKAIAHAHILLMRQRRESSRRRGLRLAQDCVKAQTKIAAQTERSKLSHFAFNFLYAVFQRRRLILLRWRSCHGRHVFVLVNFWFARRYFVG